MKERLYGEPCVYCGIPCQTVDHIPPICHRDMLPAKDWYCVTACSECNTGLGGRFLLTFEERFRFVKAWLCSRYKKQLQAVDRSDKELKTFGPTLRKRLQAGLKTKAAVIERLTYESIPTRLPYYDDQRLHEK